MSTSNVFNVFGSYGNMTIEIGTGNVLHYDHANPDEPEYADISRFDIPTYEMTFGNQIKPGDHIDIVYLNFWSHDGQYFVRDSANDNPKDGENKCSQPVIVMHEPDIG